MRSCPSCLQELPSLASAAAAPEARRAEPTAAAGGSALVGAAWPSWADAFTQADQLAQMRAGMAATPITSTALGPNLTMLAGPGGNYAFDPRTQRLVQLYPFAFWQIAAAAYGVLALVLGLTAWIVGRWRAGA